MKVEENTQKQVEQQLHPQRILFPILLGFVGIGYLGWRDFDAAFLKSIQWNGKTLVWLAAAVALLVGRHLLLSYRLRAITDRFFSWWKSIQLMLIWEFSAAISPTSLGGSLVAFFILAKEKLSAARTTTAVLYTIVLDTAVFLLLIPVLVIFQGPLGIRPYVTQWLELEVWGWSLLTFYFIMLLYGLFFFLGLFVYPLWIRWLLVRSTRLPFLRRFRQRAIETGNDIVLAAGALRQKPLLYHLQMFGVSFVAWAMRFLILNCVLLAFVPDLAFDWRSQFLIFSRTAFIYLFMAFMPTPGSSGIVELVFNGFLKDFTPPSLAFVVASVWRLLSYYIYLFVGLFVTSFWLRRILRRRA